MQHFDVAVIGSGSGNSLIDDRFDGLRIALIERDETFGGTCLNRGCIPTKMFVLPADAAASVEQARRIGVDLRNEGADWAAVRDRIFGRVDALSAGGLEWRERSANVTVLHGEARFIDHRTLQVGAEQITADRIVIATGSRPRQPDFAVPDELAGFVHTSDTIMRLEERPQRLLIVGGGFVAAEFAHIFAGFGSEVTILHRSERLLREEDDDIAEAFTAELGRRVQIRLNQSVVEVDKAPKGGLEVIAHDRNGVEYIYFADAILVATGRIRNSDSLDLAGAGVELVDGDRVRVDGQQRTSVPHIWAMGDVASEYMLKHVANAEMRTVQQNLLSPEEPVETDHRHVPHAVFSDPQIASVGATEQELQGWGVRYVSYRQAYGDVAYGWAMADKEHFVKLLADPQSWRLLGAHIVGPQAASLLQPLIQAMSFGLSVPDMARGQYWIHPALPEVVENALLGLLTAHRRAEIEPGPSVELRQGQDDA